MGSAQDFTRRGLAFLKWPAMVAMALLLAPICAAQAPSGGQATEAPAPQEVMKNPQLLAEFGRLMDRLRTNLQLPPARSESRLLPLLPETTMVYAAFPNYGEVAHQTLLIFRQEMAESQVLRDWWHHGDMAATGAKVEETLEKIYQLSQYVGEEIVVSGTMEGREPRVVVVAEVRKPGLKPLLVQMVNEVAGKSKPGVRVLDPQELAIAKEGSPEHELVVLVRADYVVAAGDLSTLRRFNERLERGDREFASTPFGQRVSQAYGGGVTAVGAADVQKILSWAPKGSAQTQATLQRSGFGDMKYWVWRNKKVGSQDVNEAELSFTGPRHGAAAWLAPPAPLGSLDFVSPKAILAGSVRLTDPTVIFEDVKGLATASNPNAFGPLEQSEKALNLSLKEDLLRQLEGEITLELDRIAPEPVWKAILRVKDVEHLQQTLKTLLALVNVTPAAHESEWGTSYTASVPSGQKTITIAYAYVDGYLVAASSQETLAEAVRLHRSGESLGKSQKLLGSLPPGRSPAASALLYKNTAALTAAWLRQASPDMAAALAQLAREGSPSVLCVYGEETAIRAESTSAGFEAGAVLVAAAVAIPNLLRSRQAANEASAVGRLRTVITAEVTYASMYPERGFAADLARLGPAPGGTAGASEDHADLIDVTIGNASCTAGAWCTASGYRFTLTTLCKQRPCTEYVVTGTPESSDTGSRNFCSTADGVIRYKAGAPLTAPVSAKECQAWPPLS